MAVIAGHGSRRRSSRRSARESGGYELARALHVAAHLRDERVGAVEAPLAAQALEELERAAAGRRGRRRSRAGRPRSARRGPVWNVGRTPMLTAAGRRRAVGERRRRRRGRGTTSASSGTRLAVGKPSSRPRSSPWTTSPRELERRAEQAVGLGDVARQQQPADVARGDDLAVDLQQRVHDGLEAPVGARAAPDRPGPDGRSGSSRRPTTRSAPSAPTSTSSMKLAAPRAGELGVEGDHDQLLHAQRGDQLGLALEAW